jgi:ethanolamine utilization protein EutS
MELFQGNDQGEKQRIIQEFVPGKQITLAHMIAAPEPDVYERLGLDECGAIGIVTLTPSETSIIAADIATKAASVKIGFLDRFTGALVITGDVSSVYTALGEINKVLETMLGFTPCIITKT